ncbi:MAG: Fic family protein [Emticicia sp.]|nr:Fic family protein [Emticicia sp.]
MAYNWQQNDWTNFSYKKDKFESIELTFQYIAGQSIGYLNGLSLSEQDESVINLLVKEAIKTSAIEGEYISRIDVISSIRKSLGYTTPSVVIKDKRSEGIAELLVKSRENFDQDLSNEVLFDWHKLLMRGNYTVEVGKWRTHQEPMQVVSGAIGKEKIHFEAPPSNSVPTEMDIFISWFNATNPNKSVTPVINPIIRSAIAHLYFLTIHPFEDGNGRIGRIIAEKALSQGLKRPILMSLSASIEADKKLYYEALQKAQQSNKIDGWIDYFGQIILKAQHEFIQTVAFSLKKVRFFDSKKTQLNERQFKVIRRMIDEGEDTFQGGMNARKYLAISKTSKATATRDLQDLVEKKILIAKGGGRSTNYQVNLDEV